MIKHLFKYLLIVLLAGGFTACSEDEGAQILGGLYEKVDIAPEPGMNLVGRVTDGKNPIEGAGGSGVSGVSGCSTGGCTEGSSTGFFPPQAVRVSSSSALSSAQRIRFMGDVFLSGI